MPSPKKAAKPAQKKSSKTASKPSWLRARAATLLGAAAVAMLLIGFVLAINGWVENRVNNARAEELIYEANHNISHSVPSTNKPTPSLIDSYTVGPSYPRYILISKLSVKAIVRPLSVTTQGQLEAPENVYDAGWYNKSSKPGEPGAMVVDGHISSWTTNGVFYGLNKLKVGDIVQIQKGDNQLVSYKVVKNQTYAADKVDMSAVLSPINPKKPGLNLISCSGQVIKGTNEFNSRTVVYAEAI